MIKTKSTYLAVVAVLLASMVANADQYLDTGSTSVQNVDDFFGLDFDVRVEDETNTNSSTFIPHVEIFGSGSDDASPEFYSFNVPTDGAIVFLDIDCGTDSVGNDVANCSHTGTYFDSILRLYSASNLGSVLFFSDDNAGDTGSGTVELFADAFIATNQALAAGDYVVEVDASSGSPQLTDNYILNISVEGHRVADEPEPDTDGDGVPGSIDLCSGTVSGAEVDVNGCSDAQVDGDDDGICDAGAPSNGPAACTGADNCPIDPNPLQENFDGDSDGDACDDDDDNDGESDADEIACGSDPLDAAETCTNVDTDNDGVPDVDDVCAATVEMAPTSSRGLGRNRWMLENGAFKQGPPQSGRLFAFTIEDTRGCSCSQIIVEAELGKGHLKYGCSNSAMIDWVNNP